MQDDVRAIYGAVLQPVSVMQRQLEHSEVAAQRKCFFVIGARE